MEDEEKERTPQEEYESLKQDLPEFKQIAEDFDIEKIFEKESSFPLREIRHAMLEKINAYSQLFETFMNPSSTPMFILSLIRKADAKDKEIISEVYNKFAKIQIKSIKLDTVYSEDSEAVFINETFNTWQELKQTIFTLIEKLEKDTDEKATSTERGYFG